MSSTYINGYVKDQSLRNLDEEEVVAWFKKVNSEFGRKALKHGGDKNLTNEARSIQGKWTNTLWNQWPKHMLQFDRRITIPEIKDMPPTPWKEWKLRDHPRTKVTRMKNVLPHMVERFDDKL